MADDRAIGPWNIYRLLVADSLSGWLDYMTWLEESLKEQVNFNWLYCFPFLKQSFGTFLRENLS
jgi:hypothetical protein